MFEEVVGSVKSGKTDNKDQKNNSDSSCEVIRSSCSCT
jgi:hypothetical protein